MVWTTFILKKMIKVTIELYPGGSRYNKKTLGIINIGNDGTGTEEIGNYNYALCKQDLKTLLKQGRIEQFGRQRGCYELLYEVLKDVFGRDV
jgi:hypothetical protein